MAMVNPLLARTQLTLKPSFFSLTTAASSIFRHSLSLLPAHCPKFRSSVATRVANFTWDDVLRVAEADEWPDDPPGLERYAEKVKLCNRGSDLRTAFVPFIVEDQVVGYIHTSFKDHLMKFPDVFTLAPSDSYTSISCLTLHASLKSPEDRTEALDDVIKSLGNRFFPGIRNELYPVTSSFGSPILFCMERAAAPLFGIKAYGIHMNGYIEKQGEKFLWIGRRSNLKSTFPGMLDHLAAGGLPVGITCKANLMKECEEEAGIPKALSNGAVAAGAVSYVDIDGYRFKRDVLFCYDLRLPEDFYPTNLDGEVESFKCIPVTQVARIIRRTKYFKSNCSLVIIDFLFRHGYITPDDRGYLELFESLRSGDCS